MKAHSLPLMTTAQASAPSVNRVCELAKAQPEFSYCHTNTVNAYSTSGSGAPETARYLVDGNFNTSMNSYADGLYVDFTLAPQYVGKTLTKFRYWFTITGNTWNGLGYKAKSFSLYYHTGSAWVFYKTVTCVVTTIGSTGEEWDIEMPCPTGRVKVVVSDKNIWNGLQIGDTNRVGREVAFGCWV